MLLQLYTFFSCLYSLHAYSVSEVQRLTAKCRGPQGIVCDCQLTLLPLDVQDVVITLSSCNRRGGWSSWSNWSECKNGIQKRRRSCTKPSPIGPRSVCKGAATEKMKCSVPNRIPEHFWGTWSQWTEFSDCDCRIGERKRTRFCLGKECTGCDVSRVPCAKPCPEMMALSNWTEWTIHGDQEARYRSVSKSSPPHRFSSEIRSEFREIKKNTTWTEWDIRSNKALRYRNRTKCEVDVKLLAAERVLSSTTVPSFWLLICSLIFMVIHQLVDLKQNTMGSAYEPLGPVDGNIPDAPSVPLPPPDFGLPQPDPTPASASKQDSGPGILMEGGLPLRDDGLDFTSQYQSVVGSKEKTKTKTLGKSLKNPSSMKSDVTQKTKKVVSKKAEEPKKKKKSRCCSVAMIVIGGMLLTASIGLLVACVLLKVM